MIIWDGNYNLLDEALKDASEERGGINTFEEQMFDVTKLFWKSYEALKELRDNSILLEACIPVLYNLYKSSLSIADIGGGCGQHLISILNTGFEKIVSKYYLIEDREMSDYANKMNSTKERSTILNGFPYSLSSEKEELNIDLVYLNGSFQYIFPTEKSVEKIKELNPKMICVERVLVGEIQTFYSVQKNLKYDIVAKFMNTNEFIQLFKLNGYKMVYKYKRRFNWNMDNFRKDMRLKELPSFIFVRNDQENYKEQIKNGIDGYISQGISFFM